MTVRRELGSRRTTVQLQQSTLESIL